MSRKHKDVPAGFFKSLKKAKNLLHDKAEAQGIVELARQKIKENTNRISGMRHDLESLIRFLKAWMSGKYRKVPIRTIVFALSAIIYFLNPFDMVHDYIPGAGYLDDASVLAYALSAIKKDIDEFLIWEKHSP